MVLCTGELNRRPARPRIARQKPRAGGASSKLADSPRTILQTLADGLSWKSSTPTQPASVC
jgi:hypothetical protein